MTEEQKRLIETSHAVLGGLTGAILGVATTYRDAIQTDHNQEVEDLLKTTLYAAAKLSEPLPKQTRVDLFVQYGFGSADPESESEATKPTGKVALLANGNVSVSLNGDYEDEYYRPTMEITKTGTVVSSNYALGTNEYRIMRSIAGYGVTG